MYIVNISFFVDTQVHDAWLGIIKESLLPLLDSGDFGQVTFSRVLSDGPADNFTYSLMARIPDMSAHARITGEIFDRYKEAALHAFGDRVLWMTTVMKIID